MSHPEPAANSRPTDPVVWLHALLRSRPAGTSLHRLRCSDDEFAQLRRTLRGRSPGNRAQWMCFSLFAVEWLRRYFDGGEWTYRDMLASLELPGTSEFDYDAFEDALEKGWGVEVLETSAKRMFFATLLLQAMPTRALVGQRGALGQHIPRLLRAAAEGASFDELVALAAERRASLPSAWQSEGGLAWIAGMAHHLAIVGIDECNDPQLRDLLASLPKRERSPVWVRLSIDKHDDQFALRRELLCSHQVYEADLRRLFDVEHAPRAPKWELFVQTPAGTRASIAVATLSDGRAQRYALIRESIDEQILAAPGLELLAQAGETILGPIALPVDQPGKLPWVFRPLADDGSSWEFVGEGSLAVSSNRVLVVPPPGSEIESDGGHTRVGNLADRHVIECTDCVTVHMGASRCEIQVGAGEDAITSFELSGDTLAGCVVGKPIFRGAPTLVEIRDGLRRRIPTSALAWRPRTQTRWRADVEAARGRVEMCLSRHGLLLWQGHVRIVPTNLTVTSSIIADGECELRVKVAEPGVETSLVTSLAHADVIRHQWRIQTAGCGRPTVCIVLTWANQARLRVHCRLPTAALGFETTEGEMLEDGADVGLDELYRLRAVAAGPKRSSARLLIGARVGKVDIDSSMPLDGRGRLELLRLRELLRMALAANLCIEAAVRVTVDDDHARRTIHVRRWSRRIRSESGQLTLWDRSGRVDLEQLHDVVVEAQSFVDPEIRVPLSLSGQAFVLDDMPEECMLVVARRYGRTWACPLACGWVIRHDSSYDDQHQCIEGVDCTTPRPPTRLPVEARVTGPERPSLATALRVARKAERLAAIDVALEPLTVDIEHPDWTILKRYVTTLGDVHAATFDLFERIIHRPVIAAAMLLSARNQDFDRIWLAFEDLPFSWDLVSIADWIAAAKLFAGAWRGPHGGHRDDLLAGHFDRVAALADRRSRSAALVFPCIGHALFGRRGCMDQLDAIANQLAPRLFDEREQAMQQLLRSTDRWPAAPEVTVLVDGLLDRLGDLTDLVPMPPHGCGFRKPLSTAPAIAALLVVAPQLLELTSHERTVDRVKLLTELRLLEVAHPEWYRDCFTLTLQLAVARHRHSLLPNDHD